MHRKLAYELLTEEKREKNTTFFFFLPMGAHDTWRRSFHLNLGEE
jgi:hypothetical protein